MELVDLVNRLIGNVINLRKNDPDRGHMFIAKLIKNEFDAVGIARSDAGKSRLRNDDKINATILRSYFLFLQGAKAANRSLFKDLATPEK
ncbi:MAG: hypothetical protein ACHQD8_01985 [Chitinophagales bacterium]